MYPFERLNKIMNTLRSKGQIMIQEDAPLFGVSKATLHRDLDQLQQQGLAQKVRGGAILRERRDLESHFHLRLKSQVEEKQLIAEAAVSSIKDDTSIFLDHSTTAFFLAQALTKRTFKNLIVVTNSLAVPNELSGSQGIRVILTGGKVESEFHALSGRAVIESFRGFNFHQVFASCGAVAADGFMTQVSFIYEILSEILNSPTNSELNILVDSSKFHKIATFRVGPLKMATRIYTCGKPPKAITDKVTASGVQLVIAQ